MLGWAGGTKRAEGLLPMHDQIRGAATHDPVATRAEGLLPMHDQIRGAATRDLTDEFNDFPGQL